METKYGHAYKRADGYYQITSGANQGKLLHRLVYEDHYGTIPTGFHIHHLDNDKNNNAPENLILLSKSHHHSLHMKGDKHPLWGKNLIDAHGGLKFLSAAKNTGATIKDIADALEYANASPVYQYLNIRNLRWNQL